MLSNCCIHSKTSRRNDRPTIIVIPIDNEPDHVQIHNCTARSSATSEMLGLSVKRRRSRLEAAIHRTLVVYPFMMHRCCLGCISLHDAVLFITVAELIFLSFFALISSRIALNDGELFYTDILEGKGLEIIQISYSFVIVSTFVIVLTLTGRFIRFKFFYLFHILWQICLITALIKAISIVSSSIQDSNSSTVEPNKILKPSAVVLLAIIGFLLFLQLWWLTVFVEAFVFFSKTTKAKQPKIHVEEYDDLTSLYSLAPGPN